MNNMILINNESPGTIYVQGLLIVRARPCFEHGVFRVPKNGMFKIKKPPAMRVVKVALAYSIKPPVIQ